MNAWTNVPDARRNNAECSFVLMCVRTVRGVEWSRVSFLDTTRTIKARGNPATRANKFPPGTTNADQIRVIKNLNLPAISDKRRLLCNWTDKPIRHLKAVRSFVGDDPIKVQPDHAYWMRPIDAWTTAMRRKRPSERFQTPASSLSSLSPVHSTWRRNPIVNSTYTKWVIFRDSRSKHCLVSDSLTWFESLLWLIAIHKKFKMSFSRSFYLDYGCQSFTIQ